SLTVSALSPLLLCFFSAKGKQTGGYELRRRPQEGENRPASTRSEAAFVSYGGYA
ncbi:hypothetical protein Dimus_003917, partial [Dionaea muscipula]